MRLPRRAVKLIETTVAVLPEQLAALRRLSAVRKVAQGMLVREGIDMRLVKSTQSHR